MHHPGPSSSATFHCKLGKMHQEISFPLCYTQSLANLGSVSGMGQFANVPTTGLCSRFVSDPLFH